MRFPGSSGTLHVSPKAWLHGVCIKHGAFALQKEKLLVNYIPSHHLRVDLLKLCVSKLLIGLFIYYTFIEEEYTSHKLTAKCIFTNWTCLVTTSQTKKQNVSVPQKHPHSFFLVIRDLGEGSPNPKDYSCPNFEKQKLVCTFLCLVFRIQHCVCEI